MCHIDIMGFKRKVHPQKRPALSKETRLMRTLGKCAACKLLPKYRRCHAIHHDPTLVKQISDNMLEIPLYLADPAAQRRKQKASRTEEQIKEQLLKRSIVAKEKRKNFTDEERKRASARTVESRRKRKARWTSEE